VAVRRRLRSAQGQPARMNERPSGDGVCPTGKGAWGWRTAPRGSWSDLNGPGVASRPESRRCATAAKTNVRREAHIEVQVAVRRNRTAAKALAPELPPSL